MLVGSSKDLPQLDRYTRVKLKARERERESEKKRKNTGEEVKPRQKKRE